MEFSFGTKEDNNYRRQQEFLALAPAERVLRFFMLAEEMRHFPSKAKSCKNNFEIIINGNDRKMGQ